MITDFDIQRISKAVVELLLSDDRFAQRMDKLSAKTQKGLMSSDQAAKFLGVSKYTIRQIAPMIGGIKKGDGKQNRWTFEKAGLKERYKEFLSTR